MAIVHGYQEKQSKGEHGTAAFVYRASQHYRLEENHIPNGLKGTSSSCECASAHSDRSRCLCAASSPGSQRRRCVRGEFLGYGNGSHAFIRVHVVFHCLFHV